MYVQACYRWVSALKEDDVSVVLTGKLPSTSSPITIISFDLATRLGTQLAQRRPDAIIVVSLYMMVRIHLLILMLSLFICLLICACTLIAVYHYNVEHFCISNKP